MGENTVGTGRARAPPPPKKNFLETIVKSLIITIGYIPNL